MRIISGNFKGRKIFFPKNKETRPLRDMVKESIFNLIENSNKFDVNIKNSNILDLFSGCGSFGLECLSRGVKKVTFVENNHEAFLILKKNISFLNIEEKCDLLEQNCFDFIKNHSGNKFNLIFLDPPFKEKKINELLNRIFELKLLKKKGIIIMHRHKKDDLLFTEKLKIIDKRFYGISKIIFGN